MTFVSGMSLMHYLGLKGRHIYEPGDSLCIGILRMPTLAPYIFHFNMENVKIPEEINLQEALKITEAVSCDYECKGDYTLHLFKKKDGLIGWLERKIASIEWIKDFETVRDGPYTSSKALEDIPGYEKIATISSPGSKL